MEQEAACLYTIVSDIRSFVYYNYIGHEPKWQCRALLQGFF